MPMKRDQSPPEQHDRESEHGVSPRDEVRSFVSTGPQPARTPDSANEDTVELADDADINTHGSER
jgi:hypothetical protein